MSWLQLTLESDLESAEQLSELLEQFGAVSVSLTAMSDEKIFGQAIEKDPDFGSVWVNYHNVDAQLTIQRKEATAATTELLVNYQGCKEDVLCYPPISKTLPINLIASVVVSCLSAGNTERLPYNPDS